MNVKVFAANFLFFVLFFNQSTIYSASAATAKRLGLGSDENQMSSLSLNAPTLQASGNLIHFDCVARKKLSPSGICSGNMLYMLVKSKIANGTESYKVNINVVDDKTCLNRTDDPRFEQVLEHLQSEDFKIMDYLADENLKLVVNVTDTSSKKLIFSFLVEEEKLTPVPAYLIIK